MSYIGTKEILRRVEEEGLIENLGPRERKNPEGAGVDLRLGVVLQLLPPLTEDEIPFIEADTDEQILGRRKGLETKLIAEFDPDRPLHEQAFVRIEPGVPYLIRSLERVKMPKDLVAHVWERTTIFRNGMNNRSTSVDPGYAGELTAGLMNDGPSPVMIQLGARVFNIKFVLVDGEVNLYRGQQGDRAAHSHVERQV